MSNVNTHVSHCCRRHGCKYGDDLPGRGDGCVVSNGTREQEFPCERCDDDPPVEEEFDVRWYVIAGDDSDRDIGWAIATTDTDVLSETDHRNVVAAGIPAKRVAARIVSLHNEWVV